MYSRKNIVTKMEPCGVPTLPAHSAHLILQKSQLKLRKQRNQNVPMEKNPLQDRYLNKENGTDS